ncbi:germ cell nuclear acidic protein [Myotis daubentonii]|uniref:germ cell nuclear acidic protein n=1 Tax=Myotis daubentonii TaxID=98922 RepID=UPI002872C032|nr:germ cell nuclear acidic protein [Myotis daubentonii]
MMMIDEILEVLSDTDDCMIQEFPIIISDDDDSNVEGPVTTEEDAADEGQMSSIEKEMEQCADDTGENLCQPPNAAEVEVEISDIKMSTDGPVPKKRKRKTKNICMTPGKPVKLSIPVPPSSPPSVPATPALPFPLDMCLVGSAFPTCQPCAISTASSFCRNTNCNIPGCFLHNIEKLKQYSGRKFKKNKDELVQKLYTLMNNTVFENKLPERLDICWNNKMLRTAGLCNSGMFPYPRERYTKIEISLKVCDSADRIRDTLIHELCHAASWLLDGIRDSHGHAWRYYARKCNLVHPELPLITRCHNYKINYKIYYECAQCKTRVGRYTKSLDVVRFVCAECKGPLVLLPSTRKDGTPIKPHVRPFAKYVKLHYKLVREQKEGLTHGDVMRMLRKDYFICKEKKQL